MGTTIRRAEAASLPELRSKTKLSAGQAMIATAVTCALVLAGTSPAFASTEADPDTVAEAVAAVAPGDLEALPPVHSDDLLTVSLDDGATIATGVDPDDGLSFASADGKHVTEVTLPGASALSEAAVSDDGSVTFAGDSAVPSINVLAAADAMRVSTVIASEAQTESFSYDFGTDATVEIQEDGSALVLKDAEIDGAAAGPEAQIVTIVADIAVPWATDAAGAAVETYYVADGGVLTQVVEHQSSGATYPVVADPTFDSPNVIQVRVRFNRAETASIAIGGWGGVIGSGNCGAMAAVCAIASGTLAYQAGVAENSSPKRCVQVTATSPIVIPGLFWWVDTYRGGPCR
ncbi:hypothetical protein [Microbacterium sp. EST19A]|uniref:hypothetical protein n=1 Tax=Microbacterium sp. EST19A TaxID=2862681 RepID=UPI001CBDFAAE|nr:hypothetical protein [Microbacterium sp. EST19A]